MKSRSRFEALELKGVIDDGRQLSVKEVTPLLVAQLGLHHVAENIEDGLISQWLLLWLQTGAVCLYPQTTNNKTAKLYESQEPSSVQSASHQDKMDDVGFQVGFYISLQSSTNTLTRDTMMEQYIHNKTTLAKKKVK